MKFSKIYNYLFVLLPTKKLGMSFCGFFFFFLTLELFIWSLVIIEQKS